MARSCLTVALLFMNLLLSGCSKVVAPIDADVIVIGAGIAGLSAALEASETDAQVIILDMNSVGGGHAAMAGGFFLVNTPLQAKKGIADSPELAFQDIMAWAEDGDAEWTRRYVEESRREVYDWLTEHGVEFKLLLPTPGEASVPRFHFTRGSSVHAVVPLLRAVLERPNIVLATNQEVREISRTNSGYTLKVHDLRKDVEKERLAPSVVIATGGFENNLAKVQENWLPDTPLPDRLLAGAGHFAKGSGIDLGQSLGADISPLDRQTIFVTGLPNPRDPAGEDGLLAQNPAAIFVNANSQRFISETTTRKQLEQTVLQLEEQSYWMIFDHAGRRKLQIRGAPWLTRQNLDEEILSNSSIVQKAADIPGLAAAAGLPAEQLVTTVEKFNRLVDTGNDEAFSCFSDASHAPAPLTTGPFYAMRLYPMTRKSMGGLRIDSVARVIDTNGKPIPGLFAAGEVTGVAQINGSHGGSGTFLGPSVLIGRIAGEAAAKHGLATNPTPDHHDTTPAPSKQEALESGNLSFTADQTTARTDGQGVNAWRYLNADDLARLIKTPSPGYWHFEVTHRLVLEKDLDCNECHGPEWPTRQALFAQEKRAQLESCSRCH